MVGVYPAVHHDLLFRLGRDSDFRWPHDLTP